MQNHSGASGKEALFYQIFQRSKKSGLACEIPSGSPTSLMLWNPTVQMWPAHLLLASFSSAHPTPTSLKASSVTFILQMRKVAQEENPFDTDPRSVVHRWEWLTLAQTSAKRFCGEIGILGLLDGLGNPVLITASLVLPMT